MDNTVNNEENQLHRYGSYKLAKATIMSMMPKRIKCTRYSEERSEEIRVSSANLSDTEIKILLFLTQICDSAGNIEALSYLEVMDYVGHICAKSVYNGLNGLHDKGFISLNRAVHGSFDIEILNNSFTSPEEDKKGYLNTNRDAFLIGTAEYEAFCGLSLYAKKLFLYLLVNYTPARGYRVNLKYVSKLMGLQCCALVRHYLREIESILGKGYYTVINSRQKYKRAEKVMICKRDTNTMLANDSIHKTQITYEKRMLDLFVRKNRLSYQYVDYLKDQVLDKHYYLNVLFSLFVKYAELGYSFVKGKIQEILLSAGKIGPAEIKKVDFCLKKAMN